jgi:ABC-type nickel/cobalt efflux system permease component RcnA
MGLRARSVGFITTFTLREAHGMGIWLELGIFLVILGFGVWQLYDVKKVIREREQRQAREKAAARVTDEAPGEHRA